MNKILAVEKVVLCGFSGPATVAYRDIKAKFVIAKEIPNRFVDSV